MTPERIADLQELCRPELIEALNSQRQLDFDGCEVGVSRQACDEAATILTALPELLAELSRLTRERDEAFNAGIEAAAKALQAMKPEYNDGPSMHVENMTLGRAVIANRAMLDASPGKKG